ncbi:hypothetical protein INT47_012315 [Mucor saturninus]|uniref:HECT-type E3 ubiquitin transferase n=1 Tax=Mucor saturninus TaxID=64648 RepID=A0A8H7V3Z6_9FUNG|nr:hypothetical protein INT47_012315 [Mucor saturninus]
MNFSFEGNYKPRRNINLGGVKSVDDKRALMAKAQAERKAREQDRLKLKSAQQIQNFFRGRKQASIIRHEQRKEFEQLLVQTQNETCLDRKKKSITTMARQLLLFYQPTSGDAPYLDGFIGLLLSPVSNTTSLLTDMFTTQDKETLDSWIWIACLLIKKVLLQSIKSHAPACQLLSLLIDPMTYPQHQNDRNRMRLVTFALFNTDLLRQIKDVVMLHTTMEKGPLENIVFQLATLSPPYDYPTSLLVQTYGKNKKITQYLTRPLLVRMLTLELLTQPFLLDHLSHHLATALVTHLPLKGILDTTATLFYHEDGQQQRLQNMAVAGLLMNITELSDIDSGKYLDGVLTTFLIQNQQQQQQQQKDGICQGYPSAPVNHDMMDVEDDSSSDDEEDNDIIMKEAVQVPGESQDEILPGIRARLELLYDSERVNHLLYRFMKLATSGNGEVIQSISSFFNTLMLRWPMKKDTILNTLLYKASNTHHLLQILWHAWSDSDESILFKEDQSIIRHLSEAVKSITDSKKTCFESWSVLFLLCEVYTRLLLTLGDEEFLEKNPSTVHSNPLGLAQVMELGTQLKNISFVMFWRANSMDLTQPIGFTGIQLTQLRTSVTHLLQQIHMRDSRRPFCPEDHWLIPDLDTDTFSSEAVAEEFNLESEQQQEHNMPLRPLRMISKGRLAVISPRLGLLNNIPFVIPFEQRVEIFRMFVQNDKKRNKVDEFYSRPKAAATVRRDHMLEDGFHSLNALGVELKNKVAISFVDEFGLEEAGIDGGGVFKEFLTGLSVEAFDTNYGLFVTTPDNLIYPNPSSRATEPQKLEYFKFLGLIIGKAVYEGILLDVAFAEFFLKKCLGKVNCLDDLASLDPELYKGLLAVKNFDGNVEDLSLDFTSTHLENGRSVNVELIANGSQIAVTNANRIQYIYLMANYRLNVQIAKQCRAFFRGLSTIVDIKWLRMFNPQELQIMLGGASVPIDLRDLRTHTVLAGFTEHDGAVQNFWKALESFDNSLRMKFVKFVTSCSRPPLLGFKELVPQFCLRNAGDTNERLPTSSTCVNLLKLPNYSNYEILRE